MKLYFDDESRSTASCSAASARPTRAWRTSGECLAIAEQITEAIATVGIRPGLDFATGLVARGDQARSAGHRVSARNVYLRAAEYFRQAFFFHREDLDADELRARFADERYRVSLCPGPV